MPEIAQEQIRDEIARPGSKLKNSTTMLGNPTVLVGASNST